MNTITLQSQAIIFLLSVALGALLAIPFDFIRVINTILKNDKKRIFLEDVTYFIICAVVTFLYMLITTFGEIRFYIIVGELAGFIIYRLTIGRLVYRIALIIVTFITKFAFRIKKFLISKVLKKKITLPSLGFIKRIKLKNKKEKKSINP